MDKIVESYDEFLNEAAREVLWIWSINKHYKINVIKTHNEYEEDARVVDLDNDSNIIAYAARLKNEQSAHAQAELWVKDIKRHGKPKNKDINEAVIVPFIPFSSHASSSPQVQSSPYAIIGIGILAAAGLVTLYAADSGYFDQLKSWWKKWRFDRRINKIVERLKDDQDIIDFLQLPKSKQRGKWEKLLSGKLTSDEQRYLNGINKKDFANESIIESYDEFLNEGRKKQTVVLSDDKKSIILTNGDGKVSKLTSVGNNTYSIVGISKPKGSDWTLDRHQTLIRMSNYDSPKDTNIELLKKLKVVREGIESYDEFINESSSPAINRMRFIDDFINHYDKSGVDKKKFSLMADNLGKISKNWQEVAELIHSGDYDLNDLKKYLDDDDTRDGVRMIYQFNQDLFTKSLTKPHKWNDDVFMDEMNYKTFKSFYNKPIKHKFF